MSGTVAALRTFAVQARVSWAAVQMTDRPDGRALPDVEDEQAPATAHGFEAFYRKSFPEVYRYLACRCGGSVSVAEDLTQETYLAAVNAIKDGATDVSLPWLMGVARHKLVDHYRRQERESRKLSLIRNERASQPEAYHEAAYSADAVQAAMDGLPAVQRAALILRYLDDLPVSKVASMLDRSIHATESLLARGRSNLRRRYGEETDD